MIVGAGADLKFLFFTFEFLFFIFSCKNKKRAMIEIAARINPISYEKPFLKR